MPKIDISQVKRGIVCFTFDDPHYAAWLETMPIFKAYHAHATFFPNGEITAEAISAMKVLQAEGHTVGLHTLHHANAVDFFAAKGAEAYIAEEVMPQLSACRAAGLAIKAFGYPNNQRNEETDKALSPYFTRFRAGVRGVKEEDVFPTPERLTTLRVMHGHGIGQYYGTTKESMKEKLTYAAENNRVITFFSHCIKPGADHIHMPSDLLAYSLSLAADLGLLAVGFDELP